MNEVASPTKASLAGESIHEQIEALATAAREASVTLAKAASEQKDEALRAAAAAIRAGSGDILSANAEDLRLHGEKLSDSMRDRLALDQDRIEAIAKGLEDVAKLADPVGRVIAEWKRPNGLSISRVATPLGVIGIIYESRPNVTAAAGGLWLKSGNAAILRGGSESFHSSRAIANCLQAGLIAAGLPSAAIQLIPTTDRAGVGAMLTLVGLIDIIIPRGGKGLIERVQRESRIPVIAHLEGLCHVYVDGAAEPEMARDIVLNSKMRRTGVCGAAETLLVDKRAAQSHLPAILDALAEAGCELRGDAPVCKLDARVVPAAREDWDTEHLDAILSV